MAAGVVIALLFVEALMHAAVAVRLPILTEKLSFMDTNHPTFGWAPVPNAQFVYAKGPEFSTQVTINSRGLRDREYPYEKPTGTSRVLVIGDSFSAALEVPLEQTWHELLEGHLNPGNPQGRVEVINAGVQGWSTGQQLLFYLHEGYKYQPDIVLLQFYVNDIFDNDTSVFKHARHERRPYYVLAEHGLELRNFPYREPWAERNLMVYRVVLHLRRRLVERGERGRQRNAPPCREVAEADELPPELLLYAPEPVSKLALPWETTLALVGRVRESVEARGSRLLVTYFPQQRQVDLSWWERLSACAPSVAKVAWDHDRPNKTLGSFLAGTGTPYLDLTPAFRRLIQAEGRGLYFPIDGHFNPEGHRTVARLLYEWIARVQGD